jgi:diketogulonate reductase-like aldo/keto reductase
VKAASASRPIPSTGELLPVIGLGTWQAFDAGSSRRERVPLEGVLEGLAGAGGANPIVDTSPMYGRAEEVVGELVEKLALRSRLFLATKVWMKGRAAGIRQMEESMARLRVDALDLIEVHNLIDAATHLATLRDWKARGRIRYLGVTHYAASAHEAVAALVERESLDFIQINYSIGEREAERRLLPLAKDRNVAVIANRPFGGAGGTLSRLRGTPLPAWAAELDCDSWSQLMLKFVVSHPAVTCAIPGTGSPDHLRDNRKAGLGRMPDAKLRGRIAALAP